jgi:hypothetical protein
MVGCPAGARRGRPYCCRDLPGEGATTVHKHGRSIFGAVQHLADVKDDRLRGAATGFATQGCPSVRRIAITGRLVWSALVSQGIVHLQQDLCECFDAIIAAGDAPDAHPLVVRMARFGPATFERPRFRPGRTFRFGYAVCLRIQNGISRHNELQQRRKPPQENWSL